MMHSRKRYLRLALAGGAALAWLSFSPGAHAQSAPGFALSRFEPSERGSDWFVGESLDLRGRFRPAVGAVAEYAYQPLVVRNGSGHLLAEPVRHLAFLHVGASVALADRFRLALDLPVQVFAEGTSATFGTRTYSAPPHAQGVGDLRIGGDVRLFGTYGDVITAAVGVQVWAPTGSREQYTGDGAVRIRPRAMVAGEVGAFVYAAQLNVSYRAHSEQVDGSPVGSDLGFTASAGVRLAKRRLVVGPEVFGSTVLDDPFARRATPLEALLGAHYLVSDVRLGAGVGTGLGSGYGAPAIHALLSAEWAPSVTKKQGGRASEAEAHPAAPPGSTPAGADADVDLDHDGVANRLDACPGALGVVSTDPTKNGCPPDTDGDGVHDVDDACPTTPGLHTSNAVTNGCPDTDRDKDGIVNVDDACPDEPGPRDPDPNRSGCPKAFVRAGEIKILDQVKFKTGSAEIQAGKDSEDVLQAVATILREHSDIAKVRVEGHTDDVGSPVANKKLSANRAAAVVTWLVAHGVDGARLSSAGFGSERPLDSNETEGGRRTNRRVEFHVEP
ncbi:Outer membrane protein [Labilithrix luteola]|uniref:Outer membrane protein n=1 Tax=Labilithrix luteola TaxID=1391654 RepID=A0A0K1PN34_9BACT|nr:OmpA family protein [Labilithrix luteola]AKU94524.1 Outer membrane protein [Labilithrix luteola]